MVRINLKGGVWKNTEDEILKVGVMKYGKNNWSRVASLLNRKTPKQCKSRWFEWLDPNIKKTEWTSEEDEKLLHFVKIFPDQWRTIAPMLSRTATQCIERFEQLCDIAMGRENIVDPTDDPRKLRAGEIDPTPEARPARPDAVDMDEDEKQMVQQARARLANTKGKKAKRKAREKHLEEARRLAQLQKLRELKAAGISAPIKEKNKTGIDYNAEIPFFHAPVQGSFSLDEERELGRQMQSQANFIGKDLSKLTDQSNEAREQKERAKDARKERLKKQTALPEMVKKLNELNDPLTVRKRVEFVLPAPVHQASELEQLAKETGSSVKFQETLLQEQFKQNESRFTEKDSQAVMMDDLRSLLNARSSKTPLMGITEDYQEEAQTQMMNAARAEAQRSQLAPSSGAPIKREPGVGNLISGSAAAASHTRRIRALLSSLDEVPGLQSSSDSKPYRAGPISSAGDHAESFDAQTFANLLEDSEQIDILALTKVTAAAANMSSMDQKEDLELLKEKQKRIERARYQAQLQRLPAVLKRGLPRPLRTNKAMNASLITPSTICEPSVMPMVIEEVVAMLRRDEATIPVRPGVAVNPKFVEATRLPVYTDKEISHAAKLVQEELEKEFPILQNPGHDMSATFNSTNVYSTLRSLKSQPVMLHEQHPDVVSILTSDSMMSDGNNNNTSSIDDIDDDVPAAKKPRLAESSSSSSSLKDNLIAALDEAADAATLDIYFDPTSKSFQSIDNLPAKAKQIVLYREIQLLSEHDKKLKDRVSKLQKGLTLRSTGYINRMKTMTKDNNRLFAELHEMKMKLNCFETMRQHEETLAIPSRIQNLKKNIETFKHVGVGFQSEIQKLRDELEAYVKASQMK